VLLACAAAVAAACGGGLYLQEIVTKTTKPARVVVIFSVEDRNGPVTDLTPESFRLSEDGLAVSNTADWHLTKPDLRARQRTLLLVDYGGRISEADRTAVANAARIFVDRMRGIGKMAVYAFDGSAEPHLISPFSEDLPQEDLAKLDTFEAKDVSTDLHSGYRSAFDVLVTELRKGSLDIGAMVVVARAPDRAARLTLGELTDHIDAADVQMPRYAVGVGDSVRQAGLAELSTAEPIYLATTAELGKALYELATKLREHGTSYYLLSFCSPARAGDHELTVEARRTSRDDKGEPVEEWGSLSHRFSAEGFGPGCDPRRADEGEGGGGAGGQGGGGGGGSATAPATTATPASTDGGPQPAVPVPAPGAQPAGQPGAQPGGSGD
jgi:hypothetical protein